MKSACAITRKLKVARYIAIVRLIFYSMKKKCSLLKLSVP